MTHGPVYFNCFPNLELSCIDDMSIHKALSLNVQTKGYDMNPRTKNILIVYRIYYKAMTTSVNISKKENPFIPIQWGTFLNHGSWRDSLGIF